MQNASPISNKICQLRQYAEKFPIDDVPGFTNIMSLDFKYVRISKNILGLLGHHSHALEIDFVNMPCKAPEHIELILKQNNPAPGHEIKILNYTYFDEWKIFLGHKKAIIVESEIIGIITNFIDITHTGMIDISRFLLNKEQTVAKGTINFLIQKITIHGLTQREQQCLFFLVRGNNYAKIAAKLNIAISTIQTHVEHIKQKLQVHNKSQVIEKAIALGFMSIVPESLINLKSI